MNIHPIFVHFPIALLTIYSVLEFVRFKKITSHESWFYIKAFTVIVGTLGSYLAFMAGDPAAHLLIPKHPELRGILQVHELWATATVTIFSIIAVIYLIQLLRRVGYEEKIKNITFISLVWKVIALIADFLNKPIIMVVLALAGLCAVTLTGAFGGSLVYGTSSDPFISFVFKFFVKN